jgi:hypothetical protein
MKTFILNIFLAIILTSNLFGQEIFIKGRTTDSISNVPLAGAMILFDSKGVSSDIDGNFKFNINKKSNNDSLRIRFICYATLSIINLPIDKDTINLGSIPIFYYLTKYPLGDDFKHRTKHQTKLYYKKYNKDRQANIAKTITSIESFNFIFRDSIYKMTCKYSDYKLSVTLDLSKPVLK